MSTTTVYPSPLGYYYGEETNVTVSIYMTYTPVAVGNPHYYYAQQ